MNTAELPENYDGPVFDVTGSFANLAHGKDFDHVSLRFKNGDFKLPEEILKAAEIYAHQAIENAQKDGLNIHQISFMKGADIDGLNGVSKEEITAYFLALSMADPENTKYVTIEITDSNGNILSTKDKETYFDNHISQADIKAALENPQRVAALARQIYYDNNEGLIYPKMQDENDKHTIRETGTGKDFIGIKIK